MNIYLSGPVGPSAMIGDATCADLRSKVEAARAQDPSAPVTVVINSPGGDVTEGVAMYNYLQAVGVDVVISGMAASIASVVAMAGRRVAMYSNSTLFLHHAWTCGEGNAAQLQQQIDALRDADRILIDAYTRKSGRPEQEMVALMDGPSGDGSSIPADRALELGLIDEVLDPAHAIAACLKFGFTTHHTAAAQTSAGAHTTNQEPVMDPEVTTTTDVPEAECGSPEKAEETLEIEKEVEKKEEAPAPDETRLTELEKKVEELTAKLASANSKLEAQKKFRSVVASAAQTAEAAPLTFPEAVKKEGFAKACENHPQLRADYMRAEMRKGSIR